VDASSKRSNTYIFFTSDQGLAIGHHGLFGKQNMYEHSVRVPFLVVGPGIPAGRRIDAPIYLQDLMPTTLELAGDPTEDADFQSLMPLIRGDKVAGREAIYGAYMDLQRMVSVDGYKLIVYPRAKRLRLYHLARDPDELIDLSCEPSHRPVIRRLLERLLQCQAEAGDPLDLRPWFADWLKA
jgi:choline-sulfatase